MSFSHQTSNNSKKLIQNREELQPATQTQIQQSIITERNTAIMSVSNGITNKEALKDKIHDIHNYLPRFPLYINGYVPEDICFSPSRPVKLTKSSRKNSGKTL